MCEPGNIPKPVDFFLQTPLYHEFAWEPSQVWDIVNVRFFSGVVDCYCPDCGQESTFQGCSPKKQPQNILGPVSAIKRLPEGCPDIDEGVFSVVLQCARNQKHFHNYLFLIKKETQLVEDKVTRKNTILKIGQYPPSQALKPQTPAK